MQNRFLHVDELRAEIFTRLGSAGAGPEAFRTRNAKGGKMYAVIGVLRKSADKTTPEFRKYWVESHTQMVKKLPGLRKYFLVPFDLQMDMVGGGWLDGAPSEDGLAVLWFDDRESAISAFASPAGVDDLEEFNENKTTSITFAGEVIQIV